MNKKIAAADHEHNFVLLAEVGVIWKVNGRPPTPTPHGVNSIGDQVENWQQTHRVSEEAYKVSHL